MTISNYTLVRPTKSESPEKVRFETIDSNQSVKPLIHVGYVKTGSTWLQEHLLGKEKVGHKILMSQNEVQDMLIKPYELWYDTDVVFKEIKSKSQGFRGTNYLPVLSHERLFGRDGTLARAIN